MLVIVRDFYNLKSDIKFDINVDPQFVSIEMTVEHAGILGRVIGYGDKQIVCVLGQEHFDWAVEVFSGMKRNVDKYSSNHN